MEVACGAGECPRLSHIHQGLSTGMTWGGAAVRVGVATAADEGISSPSFPPPQESVAFHGLKPQVSLQVNALWAAQLVLGRSFPLSRWSRATKSAVPWLPKTQKPPVARAGNRVFKADFCPASKIKSVTLCSPQVEPEGEGEENPAESGGEPFPLLSNSDVSPLRNIKHKMQSPLT